MKRRNFLAASAFLPMMISTPSWAQALSPPAHSQRGRLRLAGTPAMAAVLAAWAQAFRSDHPNIDVTIDMRGSDIAMAGLYTATCDLAFIGRDATKPEVQAFEWVYRFRPKGISILCGSVGTAGCSPALAALVHPTNPVASLTIDDLRAAFGDHARRARRWGDLGLRGIWAKRPIHLYAPEAESGTGRYFRAKILDDSNRMAWANMREYPVAPRPETSEAKAAADMQRAIARDPHALGMGIMGMEARTVPLDVKRGSAERGGVQPDKSSIANGSYPLARSVMAYFAAPPTGQVHPETLEFLQFSLSSRAQAIAENASDYLSLPAHRRDESRSLLL